MSDVIYVEVDIQDPIYINVEKVGSGGDNDEDNRYVLTFGSGTSFNYNLNLFGFDISRVTFYNPNGDEISVAYKVSDKLYVNSNVNLLNHKMIVN